MSFGLSSTGFEVMRLSDIKAELETELKGRFGDIDVSADSVFGQIIGVFSKVLTDIWEQMENVYLSQYPDMAEGISLDNAVALTGITRRPATHSEVLIALRGSEGSVIPAATQLSVEIEGDLFQTTAEATISQVGVPRGIVGIETVESSTVYTVTIDTIDYTANSGVGATADSISADLVAAMAAVPGVTVTDLGGGILLTGVSFDFDVDTNMQWWTPVEGQALETGRVVSPKNTLTVIETPVSGLDAVNNFSDADPGRDIETDAELRLRRAQSLTRSGAGTVEAIRARMLDEITDVLDCYVFENDTDTTDGEGRPPHSIEVVVSGGTDAEVALQIWNTKPAGISTYGSQSESIEDSQGNDHTINFSRPLEREAWVMAFLTVYSEEEFPTDGTDQVAQNIVDWAADNMTIGKDFIIQRLYKPIYEIPGISAATLWTILVDFVVTINDEEDANLSALFTNTLAPAKGAALALNDMFRVTGTGDTTDNALFTAKSGIAPVAGDVFTITNLGAPAVSFWGNVGDSSGYQQANITVGSTEIAVFDIDRITVAVV